MHLHHADNSSLQEPNHADQPAHCTHACLHSGAWLAGTSIAALKADGLLHLAAAAQQCSHLKLTATLTGLCDVLLPGDCSLPPRQTMVSPA